MKKQILNKRNASSNSSVASVAVRKNQGWQPSSSPSFNKPATVQYEKANKEQLGPKVNSLGPTRARPVDTSGIDLTGGTAPHLPMWGLIKPSGRNNGN